MATLAQMPYVWIALALHALPSFEHFFRCLQVSYVHRKSPITKRCNRVAVDARLGWKLNRGNRLIGNVHPTLLIAFFTASRAT
jgi:hypothetical protein